MAKTLLMFDDVTVGLLPAGYDAYAGYIDGMFDNFSAIKAKFPDARILSIDVLAANIKADCLDVEPGDASNAAAQSWVKAKVSAKDNLIVVYTSVSNVDALVTALTAAGISRAGYKLWSAHYGAGSHICGPATCGSCSWACDGTQYTETAFGHSLDESLLSDDFFPASVPAPAPANPTLSEGNTGDAVRNAQTRLNVWGAKLTVDGDFGPATQTAVKNFQEKHKLTVDGVVGPKTWTALDATPPAPKPAPAPYPAPAHLGEDFSRYPLLWDPVIVGGAQIKDYTVTVTDLGGKVIVNGTVTGTGTVLSKLTPVHALQGHRQRGRRHGHPEGRAARNHRLTPHPEPTWSITWNSTAKSRSLTPTTRASGYSSATFATPSTHSRGSTGRSSTTRRWSPVWPTTGPPKGTRTSATSPRSPRRAGTPPIAASGSSRSCPRSARAARPGSGPSSTTSGTLSRKTP